MGGGLAADRPDGVRRDRAPRPWTRGPAPAPSRDRARRRRRAGAELPTAGVGPPSGSCSGERRSRSSCRLRARTRASARRPRESARSSAWPRRREISGSTRTNSSPPKRTARSVARTDSESLSPIAMRSRSPGEVPESVVEVLEAVEVEHRERDRAVRAPAPRELERDPVEEARAIRKARQRVRGSRHAQPRHAVGDDREEQDGEHEEREAHVPCCPSPRDEAEVLRHVAKRRQRRCTRNRRGP